MYHFTQHTNSLIKLTRIKTDGSLAKDISFTAPCTEPVRTLFPLCERVVWINKCHLLYVGIDKDIRTSF